MVEQSYQGQLYRLLRMFVDIPPGVRSMARSGANPFDPNEVVVALGQLALELQRVHDDSSQPHE